MGKNNIVKRNRNIFLMSLIIASLMVGIYNFTAPIEANIIISLQFNGIEKGLNPDGTRFKYMDIISEDSLRYICKKLKLDYKETLKDNVYIEPILPSNIVDSIKEKRINGEDYTYYPNEFNIKLKIDKNIDKKYAEKFIKNFSSEYEKYFKYKYQYPFMELKSIIEYFDYDKYDYPEIYMVFQNEFNMIFSYLDVLINDDKNFISSKGYTFNDIKEAINISKNIEINRIDSLVNGYRLTKDKESLILKYEYMIRKYELDKEKNYNNYENLNTLISIIKNNEKSVILNSVGGSLITVKKLDDTYDTVASKATDSKLDASEKEEEIKHLQEEIQKIENSEYKYSEIKKVESEVQKLVNALNTKIEAWINTIMDMSEEYFELKYQDSVMLVKKGEVYKKNSLIFSIFIFIGAFFLSMIFQYLILKTNKLKRN